MLTVPQGRCNSVPFLTSPTRGLEMELREGKERKACDRYLKTSEVLLKAVNVPPLQRKPCERGASRCNAASVRL